MPAPGWTATELGRGRRGQGPSGRPAHVAGNFPNSAAIIRLNRCRPGRVPRRVDGGPPLYERGVAQARPDGHWTRGGGPAGPRLPHQGPALRQWPHRRRGGPHGQRDRGVAPAERIPEAEGLLAGPRPGPSVNARSNEERRGSWLSSPLRPSSSSGPASHELRSNRPPSVYEQKRTMEDPSVKVKSWIAGS